jgi:hypothetical protein
LGPVRGELDERCPRADLRQRARRAHADRVSPLIRRTLPSVHAQGVRRPPTRLPLGTLNPESTGAEWCQRCDGRPRCSSGLGRRASALRLGTPHCETPRGELPHGEILHHARPPGRRAPGVRRASRRAPRAPRETSGPRDPGRAPPSANTR